jgi:myo-inositol-1(or 4)-monophosphatase
LMLDLLRSIGRDIRREIASFRAEGAAGYARGRYPRGAGGDRTHPVDKKAEEIVIAALGASGLPLLVVSEEAGEVSLNGGGDRRVLVDPIDGSRNAISGLPYYCTSMAVARGDTLKGAEVSYVINLVNGDEFWAELGKGAFLNGEPVHAQRDETLYVVAYEAQSPERDVPRILPLFKDARRTRCLGAVALDLAYLAAGAVSIFINPAPSRSVDFAAGWLLVKEAGGMMTDLEGEGLDEVPLLVKRSASLLASGNRALHRKALGLLR